MTDSRPRTVVVTGASGGIGRARARAFADRGDDVALVSRGSTGLDAAAEEVREAGSRALPLEVDVADAAAVDEAAERVEDELGPIDVWVNVAFSSVCARFVDIEPAEFQPVTEVSYLGYVHGAHGAFDRRSHPRSPQLWASQHHGLLAAAGGAAAAAGALAWRHHA